jgi:hypothetical protein
MVSNPTVVLVHSAIADASGYANLARMPALRPCSALAVSDSCEPKWSSSDRRHGRCVQRSLAPGRLSADADEGICIARATARQRILGSPPR